MVRPGRRIGKSNVLRGNSLPIHWCERGSAPPSRVPERRSTIARQFIGGNGVTTATARPGRLIIAHQFIGGNAVSCLIRFGVNRPSGTCDGGGVAVPPMNWWAIVNRPYGTRDGRVVAFPPINWWAIVNRPSGTCDGGVAVFPPINWWAIVNRPSGTCDGGGVAFPPINWWAIVNRPSGTCDGGGVAVPPMNWWAIVDRPSGTRDSVAFFSASTSRSSLDTTRPRIVLCREAFSRRVATYVLSVVGVTLSSLHACCSVSDILYLPPPLASQSEFRVARSATNQTRNATARVSRRRSTNSGTNSAPGIGKECEMSFSV
jgi:hypothetical protein